MRGFIFVSCVVLIIVALYLFVFKLKQTPYYEPKYISSNTEYEVGPQSISRQYANKPLVHNTPINRGYATDNAEDLTTVVPTDKQYPEFTSEQIMDLTFAADTSY
jgi:hypothetical protein